MHKVEIKGAVVDMIFDPRAGLVNEPVSSRGDDEFAARRGGLLRAARGPRRLRRLLFLPRCAEHTAGARWRRAEATPLK